MQFVWQLNRKKREVGNLIQHCFKLELRYGESVFSLLRRASGEIQSQS